MSTKLHRNDPCHCGSGKKYKNCCMGKDTSGISSKMGMIGIGVAILLGLIFVLFSLSNGESNPDCPAGTSWSEAHGHCH